MIKILVADDHQIVIDGIHSILETETEIEVVATAHNGLEVLQILENTEIDVAILDINMPQKNGLQTTQLLKERHPNIKVLILTMYKEEEKVLELFEAGAKGYILKDRGKEELVTAVKKVQKGDIYFGEDISKILVQALSHERKAPKSPEEPKLTRREIEILKLLADGLTTAEIAKQLFISPTTVETHRRNLLSKLGVKNTPLLVRYAVEKGIVSDK
ncbi:MAG: response regulator transcription factor [Bacteroidota bacterium]